MTDSIPPDGRSPVAGHGVAGHGVEGHGVEESIGRLVGGRYRLVRQIGRGGMAVVWQGRDELLNRDVAVKEVTPPDDLSPAKRAEIRERAMREARTAARLAHPSIVTVFDVVDDGGRPWIVMALLPSRTLADVLATSGPLAPAAAARLGAEVLDALRTAHAAGVLHRDVKPSNVMLADDGRAILTDFGIATVEEDPSITVTGMVMGSPGYMAPERARGERPTSASDLWSLGATLFAATEGEAPFRREGQLATLHAVASQPPPPAVHAGLLQPIIAGLLERDPARRPDPDETYQQLRGIAAGLTDDLIGGATAVTADTVHSPADGAASPTTQVLGSTTATPTRRLLLGAVPPSAPRAREGRPLDPRPLDPGLLTARARPGRGGAAGRRRGSGAFVAIAVLVVIVAAAVAFRLLQATSGGSTVTPPASTSVAGPASTPATASTRPSTATRTRANPTSATEASSPPATTTSAPPGSGTATSATSSAAPSSSAATSAANGSAATS